MKTLAEAQAKLKELGLYDGELDGKDGPKTQAAVKAFQKLNGLKVDGKYGPKTDAELFDDTPIPERHAPATDQEPAPQANTKKNMWPRQNEIMTMKSIYGNVGANQGTLILPFKMKIAWEPSKIVTKFSMNEAVIPSATRVFNKIAELYNEKERAELGIDLWGGALNVRKMRGGNSYSMHSWGIAIDFDPERNQLKWGRDKARLAHPDALPFWQAWEAEGWVSLGRTRNYDWMHVQAARL